VDIIVGWITGVRASWAITSCHLHPGPQGQGLDMLASEIIYSIRLLVSLIGAENLSRVQWPGLP